jgi:hypothetical protein
MNVIYSPAVLGRSSQKRMDFSGYHLQFVAWVEEAGLPLMPACPERSAYLLPLVSLVLSLRRLPACRRTSTYASISKIFIPIS